MYVFGSLNFFSNFLPNIAHYTSQIISGSFLQISLTDITSMNFENIGSLTLSLIFLYMVHKDRQSIIQSKDNLEKRFMELLEKRDEMLKDLIEKTTKGK